jgi:hypothetical protein
MMKNILYVFMVLLIVSCKKDGALSSDLSISLKKWISYKATINNSYVYTTYRYSTAGLGQTAETKITVQNGVAISREYSAHASGPNGALLLAWTENQTTLNTHPEGDAAITMDEVYSNAHNNWLAVSDVKNNLTFTIDANGLIATCGYNPKGCMDDCFTGITIKSIAKL